MEVIDAALTATLLPYPALTQALYDMLLTKRVGRATAPQRTVLSIDDGGSLLLMPATSSELMIVKLVTVHPQNDVHDLPRVQATLLVLDARTGRRLYLLDGETATARRTAALSLLAAKRLVPTCNGILLIIGAGIQARAHLEAFAQGFDLQEAYIASRTLASAQRLASQAQQLGVVAHVTSSPSEVLRDATLIVTATTSVEPVVTNDVHPDAFVAAVGAYRPDMAELPAELVRRSTLYVDTLEGAQAEAGDLLRAGVNWANVTPLEQIIDQPPSVRRGPIIFKSVGHALWDLAAAEVVHRSRTR
ncbi:MAG: delta(1)-pyrroline-2-carboxylate reductase family protein [Herpetosiphonaceae bacterium]|nr:delta(1)-pyrroline-2-carboxylate reductase family protein [Herpetosiphonaceae bacterium]